MNVVDLINYLRLEGPHDLESVPTASEGDAPPLATNLQMRREILKEWRTTLTRRILGSKPSEGDPMEEEDTEEDPEEDPQDDPSEGDPMEEKDPEEDPEIDPEEDSEVSEGQLIGSEDLMGDQEEERRDRTI